MKHAGFTRIPQIGRLESLVENAESVEPSAAIFDILKDRFQRQEESVRSAIEARSRDRLKFLENTLSRRKEREKEDVLNVLSELDKTINKELEEQGKPQQLVFEFSKDEQNQIRLDLESLRMRLEQIPEEKASEATVIENRYSGLADRTFPVAVEFLVPKLMLGGN